MDGKNIDTDIIKIKTKDLKDSILSLSDRIANSNIFMLDKTLKCTASNVREKIDKELDSQSKIEKIRSFIQANSSLDVCKNYLYLIDKLKYEDTKHLLNLINEVSTLINDDLTKSQKIII